MRWIWDPAKERANRRKHGLSFALAAGVFQDPLAASRPDSHADEERWITVGRIDDVTILVIHTWPEVEPEAGEEVGRIISARKATSHERKAYEEGAF